MVGISPALGNFLTSRSPELQVPAAALSFQELRSVKSCCRVLLRLSVLSSAQCILHVTPQFPLTVGRGLKVLSKQQTRKIVGLILFVSCLSRMTSLYCLIASVLKTVFHVFFLFFLCFFSLLVCLFLVISGMMVNLGQR